VQVRSRYAGAVILLVALVLQIARRVVSATAGAVMFLVKLFFRAMRGVARAIAGAVVLLVSPVLRIVRRVGNTTAGAVMLLMGLALLVPVALVQSSNQFRDQLEARALIQSSRGQIDLSVSRGQTIRLNRPSATIFVADPAIADIQTPSNMLVFVFGKSPGRTSLFALDNEGKPVAEYLVVVTKPIEDLQALLRSSLGDLDVAVAYTPNGAVLSGTVPNAAIAEQARALTAQFLGQGGVITNTLRIAGALQVSLKVRVAEVSRSVSKRFGFNLSAVGQPGNFQFGLVSGRQVAAVLDALAAEGLVSILAEPSLTAVSGESASFLAGGEFPIPISQGASGRNNALAVEYKRFGVSLDFVPTVLSGDLISIKVRPEVSDISNRGAVTVDGFNIPALATRRAETVVELGSGQSFAIGGLIRKGFNTEISAFPGLGELPVLGALFRSSSFQKDESELVIIVTPYIVRPADRSTALQVPTDRVAPPSDSGRVLLNTTASPPPRRPELEARSPRTLFDHGFIVE
jgi:pilus assembly protein CpaC